MLSYLIKNKVLILLLLMVMPYQLTGLIDRSFYGEEYTGILGFMLFILFLVIISNKDGYKQSKLESNGFACLVLLISIVHIFFAATIANYLFFDTSEFGGLGISYLYIFFQIFLALPLLAVVLIRALYQFYMNSRTMLSIKIASLITVILALTVLVAHVAHIYAIFQAFPYIGFVNIGSNLIGSYAFSHSYSLSYIESLLLFVANYIVITYALSLVVQMFLSIFPKKDPLPPQIPTVN